MSPPAAFRAGTKAAKSGFRANSFPSPRFSAVAKRRWSSRLVRQKPRLRASPNPNDRHFCNLCSWRRLRLSCDRSANRDECLTPDSLGGPAGGSGPRVGGVGWTSSIAFIKQATGFCVVRVHSSAIQLRILRPSSKKMPLKFISRACGLVALLRASSLLTLPSFTRL